MPGAEDQGTLGPAADGTITQRALQAELERRLAELAATPDEAFGRFGRGDAALVAVLFVLAPALAIWASR